MLKALGSMFSKKNTSRKQRKMRRSFKKMRGGMGFNVVDVAFKKNGKFYVLREQSHASLKSVFEWPREGGRVTVTDRKPIMVFPLTPLIISSDGVVGVKNTILNTMHGLIANYTRDFKEEFDGSLPKREGGVKVYISLKSRKELAEHVKEHFASFYHSHLLHPDDCVEEKLYLICYSVESTSSSKSKSKSKATTGASAGDDV